MTDNHETPVSTAGAGSTSTDADIERLVTYLSPIAGSKLRRRWTALIGGIELFADTEIVLREKVATYFAKQPEIQRLQQQARDEMLEPMSCWHVKANLIDVYVRFKSSDPEPHVYPRECSVCRELAQARREQMEHDRLIARGGLTGEEHDAKFNEKGLSQQYWKARADAASEIRTRFEEKPGD